MHSPAPNNDDPRVEVRSCLSDFNALSEARSKAIREAQEGYNTELERKNAESQHRTQAIESSFSADKEKIETTRASLVDAADTDSKRINSSVAGVREQFLAAFGTSIPRFKSPRRSAVCTPQPLSQLSYREIQQEAKSAGIRANQSKKGLLEALHHAYSVKRDAQTSSGEAGHAEQLIAVEKTAAMLAARIDEVAAHPMMRIRRWIRSRPEPALFIVLSAMVVQTVATAWLLGFGNALVASLVLYALVATVVWIWRKRYPLILLAKRFAKLDDAAKSAYDVCASTISAADASAAEALSPLERQRAIDLSAVEDQFNASQATLAAGLESLLAEATRQWSAGVQAIQDRLNAVSRYVYSRCPAWENVGDFTPSSPVAIPFGTWTVPIEPESRAGVESVQHSELRFPALLPFPSNPSILIRYKGSGSKHAVTLLRAIMLRILCSLPAGKARFTVVDPLGLGKNFGQFMHLVDYDPLLLASRIWTESKQIERQLEKLTEHMTLIIQKYLRGEYETITEYNEDAGEVAEPYRFLVIADFPARFTQPAAERLMSIASAGRSCGVYILASMDSSQDVPREFNLSDFERSFTVLDCNDDRFHVVDDDFSSLLLAPEGTPSVETTRDILHLIGARALEGSRVEVPFDFVVPRSERRWRDDAFDRLSVPIGRAGARRIQYLQLGKATAQHALIVGKTGSGKSTLLHTIITSIALLYAPDAVELYLVDFKKGVEFKPYASHGLPHARVIAIESEREFGLSVLKQLDHELKRRGDLFRSHQCADLASFARRCPGEPCPRIVLLVDEFQEFFTDDDKLARDAGLLLDRLVRQGRAFGVHVILGSQTLGGAYSLARPTLDQMAIRIALQCSDADARLVLGDDNSAARVLTRPGEAIYNDSNGTVEGNSLFQVAWLPEDERDRILDEVAEKAHSLKSSVVREPIVFEGNAPADICKMPAFRPGFASNAVAGAPPVWPAWLGQPTTISDATVATFRRQGGSNLLIVGSQEDLVAGMVWSITVSIASHHRGRVERNISGGEIWLIDGTPADSTCAGVLPRWSTRLNMPITCAHRRDVKDVLARLAAIVKARTEADDIAGEEAVFFVVHWMQLIRDLRRSADYRARLSGTSEENPTQALNSILLDGPSVGVHTIVTCDSFTSFGRALERSALREFGMRVVLQMSITDSVALIDTPAAGKLGPYRGILYLDDRATAEKFTPYTLPDEIVIPPQCQKAEQSADQSTG